MNDITGEILQALMKAPPGRKRRVLEVLRGEDPPAPTSDGPLLYTVSEAARKLGVSRTTLWRLIQAGQLKKIHVRPGSYRVRRDEIETLAREGIALGQGGVA
jgi:excisionase family DNA binding protein